MNMRRTDYDAELQRHNETLLDAAAIHPGDHVLDIGCGTGQITRQAARAAQGGAALGVDLSGPAIERARELARADGLNNVSFEHADAQAHPFASGRFDLTISRFGTMFFDDPRAAFANIRRALRPGGRLVMVVWQSHERNEWDVALRRSLSGAEGTDAVRSEGPDPFSLADPRATEEILHAAGFATPTFTDVRERVYYGRDVAAALDWVHGFAYTRQTLARLDPAHAARARARLRAALRAHLTDDGVWFNSRAWIVAAHRE
jgi:SAM-dependent methyltransferase